MLRIENCSLLRTEERPINLYGNTVAEEGKVLVFDGFSESGERAVKVATGAANEVFAGFALNSVTDADILNNVVELKADLKVVTLPHTPVAGTLRLLKVAANGTKTALVVTTGYTLAGNIVTLVTESGIDVEAHYTYAPSYSEAAALFGNKVDADVTNVLQRTGVVEAGVVATTCYDTTVDWADPAVVVGLNADGQLTSVAAGGEAASTKITVSRIPSAGNPFLSVSF